jgi:hypothetical protein
LAFVVTLDNKDSIWVRDLESLAARQLSGTEGASNPFWSPDSRFLAFFAEGKLKKIDVAGGGAVALCEAPSAVGGSWGTKGVSVFSASASTAPTLFKVSEAGGVATRLPTTNPLDEALAGSPSFLPDGRHVLYGVVNRVDPAKVSAYVIDVDAKDGLNNRRGTSAGTINPVYAQPGYLLSLRQRTPCGQEIHATLG